MAPRFGRCIAPSARTGSAPYESVRLTFVCRMQYAGLDRTDRRADVSDYGLAAVTSHSTPIKVCDHYLPQFSLPLMVYSAVILGIECTELRRRGVDMGRKRYASERPM